MTNTEKAWYNEALQDRAKRFLRGLSFKEINEIAYSVSPFSALFDGNNTKDKELFDAIKQQAKKYIRSKHKEEDNGRTFCNTGDSCMVCIVTDCKTAVQAMHLYHMKYKRECIPSPYDCTGQIFTNYWKAWKRPYDGKVLLYYGISMDV